MLRSVTQSGSALIRLTPGSAAFAEWRSRLAHRNTHRRLIHVGLIGVNVVLLSAVLAVVILNPTHSGANGKLQSAATVADQTTTQQPLDALAAVNIADTVARMTDMLEASDVNEQHDTAQIQLSISTASSAVVNKPQAVTSAFLSNKDIHTYVAQPGDTIASVASKFGINTDSILWSNGLLSTNLAAGKKLLIPPVSGIVYIVKDGDTPSSLASKFQADEAKIIAYNDDELNNWKTGEQIIIPDGQITAPKTVYYGYASGFAWGAGAIYGYNGYAFGNCTWYVASQIAVPANWGNAATWAAGARAAGWHVSSVPTVGAIAQSPYMGWGLGHVAIVDGVSADGNQVLIRDMNGIAGFDRVGIAWQSTSQYPNYITR